MSEVIDVNPLAAGLTDAVVCPPCTLVIIGGSGDLSRRKLLPALFNLSLDGVLPTNFAVVGFGRSPLGDEGFRDFAREGIEKHSRRSLDSVHWPDFERSIFYHQGELGKAECFEALRTRLDEIDAECGIPGNRIFYLSIPPSLFDTCIEQIHAAGLVNPADGDGPFTRVIVEKPIGHDFASAWKMNDRLAHFFDEKQVFRIDHYLGKETVQNIMVMRFGNSIFEPLWNQKHIDHIQITVSEEEGVGTRAGYYEEAGALRDMVQNHILQLLCLVAMEPPWSLDPEVVRDNKLAVLKSLRPVDPNNLGATIVRAQYGHGVNRGEAVPGYRQEPGVQRDSTIETFVGIKTYIDNWRWSGVPFFIRTGKRMPRRASEIAVVFKEVPHTLFNTDPSAPLDQNVLALRIQPDEGVSLRISSKLPGPRVKVFPVKMDFQYGSTFGDQSAEAYERLLLDVMAGDSTLFIRRDAVEASWAWISPILEAWGANAARWLPEYDAGSWGPVEADQLIADGRRRWRTL